MNLSLIWKIPLATILKIVLVMRHLLYDYGLLKRYQSSIQTVAIGNLALGGTGKTPFILWLIEQCPKPENIAIVSRGYGRLTSERRVVQVSDDYTQVGDEPLLIKTKFPNTLVIVDRNRASALKFIESSYPEIKLVLFDDALQHLAVKAHLNIMLSSYHKKFFEDHLFPWGYLRDLKARYAKQDYILFTNCHQYPSSAERVEIAHNLTRIESSRIGYAGIDYHNIINCIDGSVLNRPNQADVTIRVVCGIADPQRFIDYVKCHYKISRIAQFPDHHSFSIADWNHITGDLQANEIILTTEKDWIRFQSLGLTSYRDRIYFLPIKLAIYESDYMISRFNLIFDQL